MSELKTYGSYLKESILDPVRDNLCNDIWRKEDKLLKPFVKEKILSIFYEWMKNLKIDKKPDAIKLVGSMAGYQYNDQSDIDINIEISLNKDRIERIRKLLPNGNLLSGTDHKINFYISNKTSSEEIFNGIYDVLKDKWIKKPRKNTKDSSSGIHSYYKSCLDQAISWARKISLDLDEINRHEIELKMYNYFFDNEEFKLDKDELKQYIQIKENNIKSSYDILKMNLHMLKSFRREPYNDIDRKFNSQIARNDIVNPDFSLNNIIYKILEKFEYIDKINETITKFKDNYPKLIDQ
jgi:hypothetical protein